MREGPKWNRLVLGRKWTRKAPVTDEPKCSDISFCMMQHSHCKTQLQHFLFFRDIASVPLLMWRTLEMSIDLHT